VVELGVVDAPGTAPLSAVVDLGELVWRRASMRTVSVSRHPEATARSVAVINARKAMLRCASRMAIRARAPLGVAARGSGCIPMALMRSREHPSSLGPCQGGRAGERTGFGLEDLQVMIQAQRLDVAPDSSFMGGDKSGSVVDLDGLGGQPHREASPA
jgi:hypothetical protein